MRPDPDGSRFSERQFARASEPAVVGVSLGVAVVDVATVFGADDAVELGSVIEAPVHEATRTDNTGRTR
jgi:hypothetical protein